MQKAIVFFNIVSLLIISCFSYARRGVHNPAIDKYPAISIENVTHLLETYGANISHIDTKCIESLKARVIHEFQHNGQVENYAEYIHALHSLAVEDNQVSPAKCNSQFHRSMHFAVSLGLALEDYSRNEGNNPVDERLREVVDSALYNIQDLIYEPEIIIGAVIIIENLVFEGMSWDEFYIINTKIGEYINNIHSIK